MRLIVAICLVITFWLMTENLASDIARDDPAVSLRMAIRRIPEWKWELRKLTLTDDENLRDSAMQALRCSDEEVRRILQEFDSSKREGEGWMTGKSFLFLRALFDLPRDAPVTERSLGGWSGSPSQVKGDRADVSWPLQWDGKSFKLTARYEGQGGLSYSAAWEYSLFRKKYRHRFSKKVQNKPR